MTNEQLGFLWDQLMAQHRELTADIALCKCRRAQLRVDRLAFIQGAFGFSIQMLAEVLNISRAQIYKWLDMGNDVTLQDANLERINDIEQLS